MQEKRWVVGCGVLLVGAIVAVSFRAGPSLPQVSPDLREVQAAEDGLEKRPAAAARVAADESSREIGAAPAGRDTRHSAEWVRRGEMLEVRRELASRWLGARKKDGRQLRERVAETDFK